MDRVKDGGTRPVPTRRSVPGLTPVNSASTMLVGGGFSLDQSEDNLEESEVRTVTASYPDGNSWTVTTTALGDGTLTAFARCLDLIGPS